MRRNISVEEMQLTGNMYRWWAANNMKQELDFLRYYTLELFPDNQNLIWNFTEVGYEKEVLGGIGGV